MPASTRLRAELIAAKTAAGFTSQAIDISNFGSIAVALKGTGTISGGTVIVEEADWKDGDAPYAGTWSLIATYTGGTDFHTDAQDIVHAPYGQNGLAWHYIRARIGDAITGGGSVSVVLLGRADG